ncbi:MAG: sulfurtransferase TusA family protein [Thermodesulfobacteriota bacterium]
MEKIDAKRRLDARGMSCPMPSVKTALELEGMQTGEVLEVITDDPVSKTDLPIWARASGNTVLAISEEALEGRDSITIYVQKG